jgi:hypothetical protein
VGVNESLLETRPLVADNTVSFTGHTGIACEGNSIVFRNNTVTDALVQGTGLKIIHRGEQNDDYVENNTVRRTANSAVMLESSATTGIFIRNNLFENIGADGTSFGALYVAGNPTTNVEFSGNTLVNAKNVANLNNASAFLFQDNGIDNGAQVVLESNSNNVRVINSGNVTIWSGANASDIWLNGFRLR